MIISNYKVFRGRHCETTALGNLLLNLGIEVSEPMIFGVGSGLGYIFWNMKIMDFPSELIQIADKEKKAMEILEKI